MVEKHAIFQGYYFFHHLGLDRNMRDEFRDHPWYAVTEEFCRVYDGPAFDPSSSACRSRTFEPMVRRVFAHREELDLRAESGAGAVLNRSTDSPDESGLCRSAAERSL